MVWFLFAYFNHFGENNTSVDMLRFAGRKEIIIIHVLKRKSKTLILCNSSLSQGSCWVSVVFVVVSPLLSLKLLPSLISEKINLGILD